MLDNLAGTHAFKEFEGTVPFFRKAQRSETPLTAFEFLLSFDEEMLSLRRVFTDFYKMLEQLLLPFQPKTENGDFVVMEETLVPPRSDLKEFTDLLACKHNVWYPVESVEGLPNMPDLFAL
ncbi:unnamed protein product [Strongylus vulgaris]|uniref:Uncharacterized protein n=1 Tax=Strongylus vulgaris TaxID=40348 RepID=A0A3P7LY91_STRVU|nr:unnamed protein product [Strongylus vulgaris]